MFLETHFIIHIMNNSEELSAQDWEKELLHVQKTVVSGQSKIFVLGREGLPPVWIVGPKFVLNLLNGFLVNKNFMLMIKGICLARCMSKFSLLERGDRKESLKDVSKFDVLYAAGDTILEEMGNVGYKAIKLIEAECTQRWVILGSKYRPLIPVSKSLENHLAHALDDIPALKRVAASFFKLIKEENDPWMVGQMYGTFRHWGHPYIDYLKGLNKLEGRVNGKVEVDQAYAVKLASDLTYLVLRDQFKKKKRWFATEETLNDTDKGHIALKECIKTGVWPNAKVIEDYGDNWHKLKLIPCYEIPDTIDLSDLYSDKAHSLQRSEVINHVINSPYKPIPAGRVMKTLLETENINVPEFLKEVNEGGFTKEDLVIGLKAKERELKDEGRFFALMSWKLRLYFVITEYLIKKHFVPLFSGLTVADDLNTMTKKLLAATEGQGRDSYDKIYIANSLDYDKWNNRQRFESNSPVFTIMGEFLGYNRLIRLTHKLFENSLIYYNDRPDLMSVDGETLRNIDPTKKVTWTGQLGGFEGLRQKGWSILNYLILRREALTRNTKTKFLAQGDNQIVIIQYSLVSSINEETIQREVDNIWKNNQEIMRRIQSATGSLGLLINNDEVVTSSELLVYGKIPVFRGKVISSEPKRWARVNCVTNDQVPSFANSLAAGTTCALAVCQYSDQPLIVLKQHHFFSSFAATLVSILNPIVGYDPLKLKKKTREEKKSIFVRLLYKDPSIGGICGTNLLRFFISRFPDPVTESLSWWKIVYNNTNDIVIKELAIEMGNPQIGANSELNRAKLLENPTCLNIPGGLSSETAIKEKVFLGLTTESSRGNIKNQLINEAIIFTSTYKNDFIAWLFTIEPIFPRFLSEFYTSTYFKITESI